MDKRTVLAVALCAAIFIVWQKVYLSKFPTQQRQAVVAMSTDPKATSPTSGGMPQRSLPVGRVDVGGSASVAVNEVPTIILGSDDYSAAISTKGGSVEAITIKEYRGRSTEHLARLIAGHKQLLLSAPAGDWSYLSDVQYRVVKEATTKTRLTLAYDDANVSIRRIFSLESSLYSIDHDLVLNFKKAPPAYIFTSLQADKQVSKELNENERRELFFNKAGGQEKYTVGDISEQKEDLGQGTWMGFSSRYFLNAIYDRGADASVRPQFRALTNENGHVVSSLVYKVSGPSLEIPQRMYYGPKDIAVLKKAGDRLSAAVDFGWFTVIAYPMLAALKWFYKYVHNYGIAIILLTVLVKVLTYPLTYKSVKSMKDMQRIQPQINRLKEKYKDDKQKLNAEMLQLMKANGYNPASGCFPILIQMPVFVALYNVLFGAVDLYGQPFFGWIHDLAAKDPYYVTPILLGLMMMLQQKLTPQQNMDPAQQKMMMFMPLIFTFMMLWLPSGLTLYMLVNSVVSIIQQAWLNRKFGIGTAPVVASA